MKPNPPGLPQSRRNFALTAAGAAVAASAFIRPSRASTVGANGTVRVAVIGLSRGLGHVQALAKTAGAKVVALCDVDSERLARGMKTAEEAGVEGAKAVADFRTLLDDPEIDAVTVAAPNFWHTPMTVLACGAGKHVYVEKPGSWSAEEARWIVAAARKHDRRVQMGNQRRSLPGIAEGIQRVREGDIGPLRAARCWYDSARGTIGNGNPVPVPERLDYALWQGPVPERPYVDNLVHYDWHWRWLWGNGELGNNGVHALDIARWGLGVDAPERVTYTGGRYCFDDDQETPDTGVAAYHCGDVTMTWEGSSCQRRGFEKHPFVAFYGHDGRALTIEGAGYRILDPEGKELEKSSPSFSDLPHFENFIASIREGAALNAEIEDAQRSALLCHYGNIAYRTSGAVDVDPGTGALAGPADEAMKLWGRGEYREGWKPEV